MVKKKNKISKIKHVYTLILIALIIGQFLLTSDGGIAIISLIIYIPLIIFIYRESVLAYWLLFILVIFDFLAIFPFQHNITIIITKFVISLIILIVAILAYRHDVK